MRVDIPLLHAAGLQLRSSYVQDSAVGLTTANSFHCCCTHHRRLKLLQPQVHGGSWCEQLLLAWARIFMFVGIFGGEHGERCGSQSTSCCSSFSCRGARSTTPVQSKTPFPPIRPNTAEEGKSAHSPPTYVTMLM